VRWVRAQHDALGGVSLVGWVEPTGCLRAAKLGADAIIGIRYDATEFSQFATEVLAYGTAVKLS